MLALLYREEEILKRVHGHALTGVRVQKVQRVQPCGWDRDRNRGRGAWWRSGWWLNLVAGKTIQPPWRAREMHPYPRLRRYFPLRGKWCAAPIGVHFQRAVGPVVMVFAASGSAAAAGGHIYSSPKALPPPSEPSEPSRRRRVQWRYHNPRSRRLRQT